MNTLIPSISKKKFVLACAIFILTGAGAFADSFATLAGSGDSITLREGETALVMSAAGTFTYGKPGRPCSYIRLSSGKNNILNTLRDTSHVALPLVGPCIITVRSSDGFVGMRIVPTGIRPVTKKDTVASVVPTKSTARP